MKKQLSYYLAIFAINFSFSIQAQEVVSSAGNYYEHEHGSISWTLGETVIETFETSNLTLTQGFQQPVLSVSTLIEEPGLDFQITAFPNPTRGYVNISTNFLHSEEMIYQVYDMQWRFISSNRLEGKHTMVSFSDLHPGTYFIRIISADKPVKVLKIIKQ